MFSSYFQIVRKIPGQFYLWFAIIIFGAANAVTRKLTEIGAQHFTNGHNPVSLCNVLFVGNLCALMVLIIVYRKECRADRLRQISQQQWLNLSLVAIMAGAIAPGLIFQSLGLTTVNNVILVGRLEPPLTLALSIWLLHERVNSWEILGAIISFIGVILTITLPSNFQNMADMNNYFSLGTGEILTAIAAIVLAISTIINKNKLSHISLGIYSIFRTALGTIVFFFVALILYGSDHFMDVFSPFLWKWMLIYGSVIVVIGQSFWIAGLRATTVSQALLIGSFTPVIGIIAAYLVLGEIPTFAQYIGGGVILLGIVIGQFGLWRKRSLQTLNSNVDSTQKLGQIEGKTGFKGM
jgi:drug/metabolite transporter (DMT)-like permease